MKEMFKGKVNSPETKLDGEIDAITINIKVENIECFPPAPNLAVIGIDAEAETIKYGSISGNILSGCVRGYQGTAKPWNSGTIIARNFTEDDHASLIENINELEKNKANKTDLEPYATKEDLSKIDVAADKKYATKQELSNINLEPYAKKTDIKSSEWDSKATTQYVDSKIEEVVGNAPDNLNTLKEIADEMAKDKSGVQAIVQQLSDKASKTDIKTKLSELADDSTHRLVTDSEKEKWTGKQDKLLASNTIIIGTDNKVEINSLKGLSVERCRTDGYSSATPWESVDTTRDLEDWIGDFDKRTRELKNNKASIVNDLTTGGTDKALSAEQGKELKRLIDTKPNQDTTYTEATTSKSGLMSSTDKKKLDGLDKNAIPELIRFNPTILNNSAHKIECIKYGKIKMIYVFLAHVNNMSTAYQDEKGYFFKSKDMGTELASIDFQPVYSTRGKKVQVEIDYAGNLVLNHKEYISTEDDSLSFFLVYV